MDDTSEDIRHQMEETKSQLSEKLELLETQVAESVQSTGIAMSATAEAVEETVQTVKGAVNDTVQSVKNAFDIRRQIDRHPWLILGGCALLGYLAVDFLTKAPKRNSQREPTVIPPSPPVENDGESENQIPVKLAAGTEPIVSSSHPLVEESSSWRQMKEVAFVALIGAVQEVVSRTLPSIVDILTGESAGPRNPRAENVHEKRSPPRRPWSPEVVRRQNVTSSARVRSDDSF